MSLTGRGLSITDAPVQIMTGGRCKVTDWVAPFRSIGYEDCINRVPFNIGTDLLERMRVYISAKRQTVYISTVDAAPSEDRGTIAVSPGR
jgi:hypothetical protein